MAEGITLKRIIDMDEAAELSSSDYALVDSATGGPKKFALGNELYQLKEELAQNEIKHYGGDITSFTWVDGFIYNDSVSSNSGWQRTTPIQLKKGETLSFTGGKGDTALPINAISKYDDGTYSTLKSYSGTGSESISYTATAEIYVVVSVKKDVYSNNLTVTKIGDISSIPEYVYDSINPTVIDITSGVAVNYPIVANTTYLIENRGANNITLSTRVLPSSTSVDVISLPVNSIRELKTSGNANYIVSNGSSTIAIGKSDTLELFIEKTKKAIVNKGDSIPLVNFTFSKDMFDFTSDLSGIDFMDNNGSWYSIPETITTKFDSLVSSYSSYVSKVDAGSDVNLPYPSYANLNGTASGNYQGTPTYKTYLYKFETNDSYVNGTSLNKKKKVLLIGATHGSETAGAFNLYLFAKNLCECANEDYFKLRSAFDFYIVPCLNGYGMYHLLRWNANGVNINRNYPIANFEVSGQPYEDDYTGASAGSEFETQLIIKLHEKYSFNIAVDHHNYGVSNMQFYTESWFERFRPLSNSALVDCAFSFIKNKASYFGNNYQLFVQTENATLPIVTLSDSMPCMAKWFFEKEIDYAATIEISNTINYVNGTLSPSESNPKYTADVFAVGEFTFRNQILHYGGLVLGGSGD